MKYIILWLCGAIQQFSKATCMSCHQNNTVHRIMNMCNEYRNKWDVSQNSIFATYVHFLLLYKFMYRNKYEKLDFFTSKMWVSKFLGGDLECETSPLCRETPWFHYHRCYLQLSFRSLWKAGCFFVKLLVLSKEFATSGGAMYLFLYEKDIYYLLADL